ncbi:hypothetical protein L4D20_03445 [Vibrio kyushuensis]|uniref:hypothetical protein n=1 Tax=Vibrio TaxID=662 RepID=UPI003D14F9E5
MSKYIISALLCLSFSALSDDYEAINIEQVVSERFELAFPNEDNIEPNISDFTVINYILLSEEGGERWAVVTLKNESSSRRTLTEKHLLSTLANGDYIFPSNFSQSFKGNEVMSVIISFAVNKFPILSIKTRK